MKSAEVCRLGVGCQLCVPLVPPPGLCCCLIGCPSILCLHFYYTEVPQEAETVKCFLPCFRARISSNSSNVWAAQDSLACDNIPTSLYHPSQGLLAGHLPHPDGDSVCSDAFPEKQAPHKEKGTDVAHVTEKGGRAPALGLPHPHPHPPPLSAATSLFGDPRPAHLVLVPVALGASLRGRSHGPARSCLSCAGLPGIWCLQQNWKR